MQSWDLGGRGITMETETRLHKCDGVGSRLQAQPEGPGARWGLGGPGGGQFPRQPYLEMLERWCHPRSHTCPE